MAYRSSVHESTGYTTQFLVLGQNLSLPLECMYSNPEENETIDILEFVHTKQQAFQRSFELVRRNLNKKHKRRNTIYKKRFKAQHTKKDKKFFSIIQPSLLERLLSFQALERTVYRWKMFKQRHIQYEGRKFLKTTNCTLWSMKTIFRTSTNVKCTYKKQTKKFSVNWRHSRYTKHIDGTLNHDDCLSSLPATPSAFTAIPAVKRTIASIPTSRTGPIISSAPAKRKVTRPPPVFSRAPALEQPSQHTWNDVAMQSPNISPSDH